MTTLWLLEGTWGGTWARDCSLGSFRAFLREQGFDCYVVEWSTNVDGVPSLFDAKGNRDWIAAGYALRYRLQGVAPEDRNILCHSHGAGGFLYQAILPDDPPLETIAIRRALSVCSPPRSDLERCAQDAIGLWKIGAWRHIYADGWDKMARFGQMFDGHWGWRRKWEIPEGVFHQVPEKGIGHSGIFTKELRQRFIDSGHFDFLHGIRPAVEPKGHDGPD